MAVDQGPVVQSALLRAELVRLRKEKELTQEQVAHQLEWSSSKLIRIEGGKNSVSRTDLQALLTLYGVTSPTRMERLQELAKGARQSAWWDGYRGEIADAYLSYVGLEAGASVMRHFHGSAVHGLLQTRAYAEVLASGSVGPIILGTVVKLRLQRQQELAQREDPPQQIFVLDEAVIRRHVGIKADVAIMPNQLRHIVKVVEENELITVRVIPFNAGAHMGMRGPFSLLEFEGGLSDALYLEGARDVSVLVTGDDPRIADYQDGFESLLDESLSVEESLDLMRNVAEEMA
ncbi:helix-turn-helix domain-containing protein [Actinomadura scrupuli]|uniref:helix-turn-helix domain-containing protein n=1 Tax=Actinomadura scrupuli TaxID=559629 RepID=UPI003D973C3F